MTDPLPRPSLATGRLTRLQRRLRTAVLSRRRGLAVLCAAVAAWSGLQVLRPPEPPTTAVTVAARDLPGGTVLTSHDIEIRSVARGQEPDGLVGDIVGRVLAAPVRAGEPLTDVRMVGPSLTRDLPGTVAVPVRLPDADQVALLRVGDRVDLVGADPQGGEARLVAADVTVLAVPPARDESKGDGLTGRLVVVAAAPTDVDAIAQAAVTRFLTYSFSR